MNMNIMKKKGFALPELIVGVLVLGLMVVAVSRFSADVFSFNRMLQSGLKNQNEARKILRPFVNEVRSASPSSLGAFALAQVSTSSFAFYSDIDNDGLKERVRYFLQGSDFKKGIIKPAGNPLSYSQTETIIEVVHNVIATSTPVFQYFDTNYNGTSSTTPLTQPVTASAVRLVKVTLVVDEDVNKMPLPFVVTTQVSFRNLKDNL